MKSTTERTQIKTLPVRRKNRFRYDKITKSWIDSWTFEDVHSLPTDIKPITKGNDFYPVTINDIFAKRTEARLTAIMQGMKEKVFDETFDRLKKDITRPRIKNTHYYGRNEGWHTTLDEFQDFAPIFKSQFNNCTRDSMRLLLLQTRRDMKELWRNDKKRYLKLRRKDNYNYNRKAEEGKIRAANQERIFPLETESYESIFKFICNKRFGGVVLTSNSFNVSTGRNHGIMPVIMPRKIVFVLNGAIVTRETWATNKPSDNIKSCSKLKKISRVEQLLSEITEAVLENRPKKEIDRFKERLTDFFKYGRM